MHCQRLDLFSKYCRFCNQPVCGFSTNQRKIRWPYLHHPDLSFLCKIFTLLLQEAHWQWPTATELHGYRPLFSRVKVSLFVVVVFYLRNITYHITSHFFICMFFLNTFIHFFNQAKCINSINIAKRFHTVLYDCGGKTNKKGNSMKIKTF